MTLTEPVIIGALSPSRAGDFMTCPLLYRFRVVDQLPEKPSPAAVRGTVVHAVLERLYDLPAPERSVRAALELLEPQWSRLLAEDPQLGEMFADDDEQAAWLGQAREMLERYSTPPWRGGRPSTGPTRPRWPPPCCCTTRRLPCGRGASSAGC